LEQKKAQKKGIGHWKEIGKKADLSKREENSDGVGKEKKKNGTAMKKASGREVPCDASRKNRGAVAL